ncbi:DUF7507 domain-containing protein [Microbacterium arabinogalactanolyticum]|uniref:DUF7507 domain-containing protein n=1 Tax=Microbacterium arabinogalactanolyticum TaxID=69365 RepID=UPI004043D8C2
MTSPTSPRAAYSPSIRVVLATLLASILVSSSLVTVPAASAAAGSFVGGTAWADTNRNGMRDPGEAARSGAAVQLIAAPGSAVIATTTTAANGSYAFPDVADGDYSVRMDAPGAFKFPAAASGDDDLARVGDPAPGEPERGVSAPFTISGATRITGLDAGLQPIADLKVTKMDWSDACEGYARTGVTPFDADDEPGHDSGTANCRVRPADSVYQNYSVALTGLPTGASVPNVVAEFTVSSPDGAKLRLKGPAAGGMPDGCLYTANGAVPTSSSRTNPDGSITVTCNLGTMSSNVAAIQFVYDFANTTPIPSHAEITMHSYAAGGEAGASNTVQGPLVEVTGIAKWELRKALRGFATGPAPSNPRYVVRDGKPGYQVRYMFTMEDMLKGKGSELQWPLAFHDRMPEFPNAIMVNCAPFGFYDGGPYPSGESWTMPNCPTGQTQGPDGWTLKIQKGSPATLGHTLIDVWIPAEDIYRNVNPTWQPGQATPIGAYDFDNLAKDTDTWAINGGQLNYGDGKEPGYDGTGDNLATFTGEAKEPKWDLQKFVDGGPAFATVNVGGVPTQGYTQRYRLRVIDTTGTPNLAPFLDDPLTFKDKFFVNDEFVPGAVLARCYAAGFTVWRSNNTYAADTGTPTCTTGTQPGTGTDMNTGWELTFHPNQWAYDLRYADMFVDIFVPLDKFTVDPCSSLTTDIEFKNMAVQSDGWTAAGAPMNRTGFEPGWDGDEATGNNVVKHKLNFSSQCGSMGGTKGYTSNSPLFAGAKVDSYVNVTADNARVTARNLVVCDVFDTSVLTLVPGANPDAWITNSGAVDKNDYVIEYGVGPNVVDTQAGAKVNNLYPADTSSIKDSVSKCRGNEPNVTWSSDPTSFGENWRDQVNMVRARPADPALSETGPFVLQLNLHLQMRLNYNGGPNAGELIPEGVRLTNEGGWPSGHAGEVWGGDWSTVERQVTTVGPGLAIEKTVTPNTYLPGDTVTWNLNAYASRVHDGETMVNVRVVDTIPAGLEFNLSCTRDLLPAGVTVAYDATTRQATFSAGDIVMENVQPNGNRWMFHQTSGTGARGSLKICTDVSLLAQPGTSYVNRDLVMADNTGEKPSAQATILVVGTGKLGIEKGIDKPYVASGETYTWSLDWGNTSTNIPYQDPDVIDVLPWNGDHAAGALSKRDQYATSYQGVTELLGALDQPSYLVGGSGDVEGTWYYATADPSTIDHDSRAQANADPQAAGGLWRVEAEISDFSKVTAIRFVSSGELPIKSRVRALIPQRALTSSLDNVYVNRATLVSPSFPDDLLYSNEPYVQVPGFTLGDLVWADRDGDGRFTAGVDVPFAGVKVEVLDADGRVVATRTTDANGRWSAAALPEGTYRARIPSGMFQAGGPLEKYLVKTTDASSDDDRNENASNNNTAAPDPRTTGLTSTPVTLAYRYGSGNLAGGSAPLGDDVAHLAGELIGDDFTDFTVDLFVTPEPRVDIEKSTNGKDADTGTGPFVPVGDMVTWKYVVTNTGATELHDLTVTDDKVSAEAIDCDATGSNVIAGPIAPGASFACIATGTATAGQYENLSTVIGFGPAAGGTVRVSDADPSHYFGAAPDVDIEKHTNGQDADTGTGPLVAVGGAVRWTYEVTNTGNVPLTNVTVTDDRIAAGEIDCVDGSNVVRGPVAPGDSFTCVARGTATIGQYENTGAVVGTAPATTDADGETVPGVEVDDADPSHYLGIRPAIDIEKSTNGQDADDPDGPLIASGGDVRWTYVVTNTGTVPLTAVTVVDDKVDAADIDCSGTGSNVIAGPLAPGATFTCLAAGTAVVGQYANIGSVSAIGPATTDVDGQTVAGAEVTDEDPSHYFGVQPSIDIEKATNGEDADQPTGPSIPVGGDVEWTYVVTNTGNAPLTDVTVTDDREAVSSIDCAESGSHVVPGPLAPGESFTCVAHGTARVGQYANLGTVVTTGPVTTGVDGEAVPGESVTDEDWSHYYGTPLPAPTGIDLARTGGTISAIAVGTGMLLLTAGLLMLLMRRRRSERAD